MFYQRPIWSCFVKNGRRKFSWHCPFKLANYSNPPLTVWHPHLRKSTFCYSCPLQSIPDATRWIQSPLFRTSMCICDRSFSPKSTVTHLKNNNPRVQPIPELNPTLAAASLNSTPLTWLSHSTQLSTYLLPFSVLYESLSLVLFSVLSCSISCPILSIFNYVFSPIPSPTPFFLLSFYVFTNFVSCLLSRPVNCSILFPVYSWLLN
jgi:hypothetical protein